MRTSTKTLLLRLIKDQIDSYNHAIYYTRQNPHKGYEDTIARHQKKIADLERAKQDLIIGK